MDTKNPKRQPNQHKGHEGHVIRVDDDVFRELSEKAFELGGVDASRNDALRAILGLEPKDKNLGGRPPSKRRASRRRGGRPATR